MRLKEKIERVHVYLALDSNGNKVLYSTSAPPKGDYIEARQTIVVYPDDDIVVCADDDYNFCAMELSKAFRRLKEAWDEREETEDVQEIWCEGLLNADFSSDWAPDRYPRLESFEEYKNWWLNTLSNDPWGTYANGAIFNLATGEIKEGELEVKEWHLKK